MNAKKLVVAEYQGNELTESLTPSYEIINEASADGSKKTLKFKGHFANCDEATLNKRYYKKQLWERELGKLRTRMEGRNLFGELDHPSDGKTLLNRVSHVITDMRIEGNRIIGEAEVLPTPAGQILRALLESNCKVGVSSRGYGSVQEDQAGNLVVQDDFVLATFDAVGDPAAGAFPSAAFEATELARRVSQLTESEQSQLPSEFMSQLAEAVAEEKPTLVESTPVIPVEVVPVEATPAVEVTPAPVEEKKAEKEPCGKCGKTDYADIRAKLCDKCAFSKAEKTEELEKELAVLKDTTSAAVVEAITKAKVDLVESIRAELLADPAVAGAKSALEAVRGVLMPYILPEETAVLVSKLEATHKASVEALEKTVSEQVEKVKALEDTNNRLEKAVKRFGYGLYLEKLISAEDDSESIRKMVGDVTVYENIEAIKSKVDTLKEFFAAKKEESKKVAEAKLAEQKKVVADSSKEISEAVAKISHESKEKDDLLREAAQNIENLQKQTRQLQAQLQEQKKATETASLVEYAAAQIKGHPAKAKILQVLENTNLKSRADVDLIVETFTTETKVKPSISEVKDRIRNRMGAGGISQTFDDISESNNTTSRTVEGVNIDAITNVVRLATRNK